MSGDEMNGLAFLDKPVLVAGASGFVGSHIVRRLLEDGRKVRVLLRKTSSQAALEGLPVEIHYGDVLQPETLVAAMHGCGTVYHSVVDPRFWLTDTTPLFKNNVEGLVNSMEAALSCGIERFVFTSSMGTLGVNPDGPVTEEIEFNWYDKASPYILARLEAEQTLLKYCREKALPGVALCIANTYGPHDYQPTPHNGMLWEVGKGKVGFAMDAGAPSVDIRDVADAAVKAEVKGRLGERYIIANEYISNRDFYTIATEHLGQKPPRMISLKVAMVIASIGEAICKLFRIKDYLLRKDAIILSDIFKEMDHGKATRDLDWHPRPVRETVIDAVEWFRQREAQS